ncbi:hypothetical protein NLJ89_g1772 [Agrocybe chaxingu]|uniref:Uncharacterized protein n=1 Tax=Agrocybe chaxingu TaxID=84603 RepID=A0A9W8TCW5_9AGAR|nr:hypothetical protein NLJ89_g1772 [Agrocybe chaxingu]
MRVVLFRGLVVLSVLFFAGLSLFFIGLPEALRNFQLPRPLQRGSSGQAFPDIDISLDNPESPSSTASKCESEDIHVLPVETGVPSWDSSRFLQGPPTTSFKENLLNDTYYITSWADSGFTNQFMGYVNMIYVGLISDRIPILPPFGPHHMSYDAGALRFSNVFNLTQLKKALNRPILEWHEVKEEDSPSSLREPSAEERESIGCWSTRKEAIANPLRVKSVVDHLKLDIAYTRVPSEARWLPNHENNDFLVFHQLVPYIFPRHPWRPVSDFPLMQASPSGLRLPPDEQVSCFDYLYYITSSRQMFEMQYSWSPPWRLVGTHLRFTDDLVDLAQDYLRRAFHMSDEQESPARSAAVMPPFIAVHMRRGDFGHQCRDGRKPEECFVPLEEYSKAVETIQHELREKKAMDVEHVVLMSDEKDPKFWEETKKLGWAHFDHEQEKTVQKCSEWYPVLIDSVAQSLAAGFVGTGDSTYSLMSARRVEDWNAGPRFLVRRNLGHSS